MQTAGKWEGTKRAAAIINKTKGSLGAPEQELEAGDGELQRGAGGSRDHEEGAREPPHLPAPPKRPRAAGRDKKEPPGGEGGVPRRGPAAARWEVGEWGAGFDRGACPHPPHPSHSLGHLKQTQVGIKTKKQKTKKKKEKEEGERRRRRKKKKEKEKEKGEK